MSAKHVITDLGRSDKFYVFMSSLFVGILLITNIIGTKLFVIFADRYPEGFFGEPFVLTTGIITYPITFWLTDIVSEIWGKKRADLMVLYGFIISIVMLGLLEIARALPPAAAWTIRADLATYFHPDYQIIDNGRLAGADSAAAQAAYAFTFEAPGVLLFASMTAYLVAQLLDNYMFHFWRRVTGGRMLWLRNNGSTLVSQLVDTIIVNSIFLYFVFQMDFFNADGTSIAQIIVTVYFFKMMMALMDTPLIYAGVFFFTRIMGIQSVHAKEQDDVIV